MALPHTQSPETFDQADRDVFASAEEFASLLWRLGQHRAEFSATEADAYHKLRDIGLQVMRKRAASADAAPYLDALSKYGGDVPMPKMAKADEPAIAEQIPVAEAGPLPPPETLPPLHVMPRGRGTFEVPQASNDHEIAVEEEAPAPEVAEAAPPQEAAAAPEGMLSREQIDAIAADVEALNKTLNQDIEKEGLHPWQLLQQK